MGLMEDKVRSGVRQTYRPCARTTRPAHVPDVLTSLCDCVCVQVIKNHFASEYIYNKYKDLKTCDIIEDNPQVCAVHCQNSDCLPASSVQQQQQCDVSAAC